MARLDWNDFQLFLAVARTGRISEAGRQLGLDHATVGRRVRTLEHVLKARLFDRSPKGYALTEPGARLLASAEAMENAVSGAQGAVGEADLLLSGSVRIGAPDGFGSYYLVPQLVPFVRRNSGLEIQIVAMPRGFSLTKHEVDIAIGLSAPSTGRLTAQRLTDYTLRIYCSRAYLAERQPPRSADEIRRHRGVGYIQDLIYAPELEYLEEISPGLRPRLTSSNMVAQLQATRAGAGLCVLPDFLAAGFDDLVPVLGSDVVLRRSLWLLLHEDTRHLARIRQAAVFIIDQIRQDAQLFLPLG